jgi:hypothetical protein
MHSRSSATSGFRERLARPRFFARRSADAYSALEVNDKRMMLRGATKESLKSLPEFKYNP